MNSLPEISGEISSLWALLSDNHILSAYEE
jgi:hypothetical protein